VAWRRYCHEGDASYSGAACTICRGVCGGLITFLGAASSGTPGPLAPPDSDAIKALTLKEQLAKIETPASGTR
jgi:hypothetical protein